MKKKFEFPNAGIHIVSHKIGEADYFLEELKLTHPHEPKFNYLFSAFISALRSITFTLQYVMTKYPDFDDWYKMRQDKFIICCIKLLNSSTEDKVLKLKLSKQNALFCYE